MSESRNYKYNQSSTISNPQYDAEFQADVMAMLMQNISKHKREIIWVDIENNPVNQVTPSLNDDIVAIRNMLFPARKTPSLASEAWNLFLGYTKDNTRISDLDLIKNFIYVINSRVRGTIEDFYFKSRINLLIKRLNENNLSKLLHKILKSDSRNLTLMMMLVIDSIDDAKVIQRCMTSEKHSKKNEYLKKRYNKLTNEQSKEHNQFVEKTVAENNTNNTSIIDVISNTQPHHDSNGAIQTVDDGVEDEIENRQPISKKQKNIYESNVHPTINYETDTSISNTVEHYHDPINCNNAVQTTNDRIANAGEITHPTSNKKRKNRNKKNTDKNTISPRAIVYANTGELVPEGTHITWENDTNPKLKHKRGVVTGTEKLVVSYSTWLYEYRWILKEPIKRSQLVYVDKNEYPNITYRNKTPSLKYYYLGETPIVRKRSYNNKIIADGIKARKAIMKAISHNANNNLSIVENNQPIFQDVESSCPLTDHTMNILNMEMVNNYEYINDENFSQFLYTNLSNIENYNQDLLFTEAYSDANTYETEILFTEHATNQQARQSDFSEIDNAGQVNDQNSLIEQHNIDNNTQAEWKKYVSAFDGTPITEDEFKNVVWTLGIKQSAYQNGIVFGTNKKVVTKHSWNKDYRWVYREPDDQNNMVFLEASQYTNIQYLLDNRRITTIANYNYIMRKNKKIALIPQINIHSNIQEQPQMLSSENLVNENQSQPSGFNNDINSMNTTNQQFLEQPALGIDQSECLSTNDLSILTENDYKILMSIISDDELAPIETMPETYTDQSAKNSEPTSIESNSNFYKEQSPFLLFNSSDQGLDKGQLDNRFLGFDPYT